MAYTVVNFKTKKALKEAVFMYLNSEAKKKREPESGYDDFDIVPIRCYQPGLGPDLSNFSGKVCLEGPHYPKAHTWYCEAELLNGIVIKVK